jgi:hypothetical protein
MKRFSDGDIVRLCLMAEHGHSGISIARALGRTAQAVRRKCVELGIRLKPDRKPLFGTRIKLAQDVMDRLAVAARDYGVKPCSLASMLLRIIVRNNWIDRLLEPPPSDVPLPPPHAHRVEPRVSVPVEVLRDREQRCQLNEQRDLVGQIMGDPVRPRSLGAAASAANYPLSALRPEFSIRLQPELLGTMQ